MSVKTKFTILFIFVVIATGIYIYTNKLVTGTKLETIKPTFPINLTVSIKPTLPQFDPTHLLTYSGWIPYWGSKEGLSSLKEHYDKLNSVSPVWYEVNANGLLINIFPSNKTELKNFALFNNIEVIPAIALFDHEILTSILQDKISFDRHIQSILNEVKTNNYDGIDLDYESTKFTDKDQYFLFLTVLSQELHKENKKLVVTVIAKWGDDINYPSLPETRQVQDWTLISPLVDEIRIMAYDYTFSKSYFPGPIAPLGWVQDVLEYARTKIPAEKIVLGVHLYSYEWSLPKSEEQLDFIIDYLANKQSDKTARSFEYSVVKDILKDNLGESSVYQGEDVFKYSKLINGIQEKRVLVYISPKGVEEKINLARRYGIKGVVFWRLGNDADLF